MSQPDLAEPGGGLVDLNYKPQVFSGGCGGGGGSGFDQPLWDISAGGIKGFNRRDTRKRLGGPAHL